MNPPGHLAILVALREEHAALEQALAALPAAQRERVHVARSGLGGAPAARAARKLLAEAPATRLLAVTGFCGGLDEAFGVGDLLLADAVAARRSVDEGSGPAEALSPEDESGGGGARGSRVLEGAAGASPAGRTELGAPQAALPADPTALAAAQAALNRAGITFHTGLLVTVAQAVLRPADKRRLAVACGALGVDMESAAVARVARAAGCAFLAVRAVSDGVNDALPPEVSGFLDDAGRLRAGPVVKYALGGPAHLKELWRLKSRSDRAAAALTEAWRALAPALLAIEGISD